MPLLSCKYIHKTIGLPKFLGVPMSLYRVKAIIIISELKYSNYVNAVVSIPN